LTDFAGVDETVLTRLSKMVGADVMQEIIDLFREHTPQRIEAAREGLRSGVLDEVTRAMHTLKSSAAMIGASRVEDIARRVEETATQQRADALAPQLDDLDSAVAQVEAYLETRGSGC
jgi:HPt (histidine-containing phosphotransfer) domain-containing protein